jgi:hypothetical protein
MDSGAGDVVGFDLSVERAALAQTALELLAVAEAPDHGMSRGDLADQVIAISKSSERAAAIAGSFMAVGADRACSYVKGEATMSRMVNSQSRLSQARVKALKRAGQAQHVFPTFYVMLLHGSITLAHVDLMFGLRRRADTRQIAAAEPYLAELAARCTPEEFAAKLAEWDAHADVNEHFEEFLRAQTRRQVHFQRDLFGTVYLDGVLDPIHGELLEHAVTQHAKGLVAEQVSRRQARHDALINLVLGDPDERPRPHIEIIYPQPEPDPNQPATQTTTATRAPVGPVTGWTPPSADDPYGPLVDAAFKKWMAPEHQAWAIPDIRTPSFDEIHYPRTARGTLIPPLIVDQLAPRARVWIHTLTPNGDIADDRPAGRHFTQPQKRLIRLRDNRCQHTGCRRRPRDCQYDHVHAWETGGPTLIRNGQLLCSFHHHYKHHTNNQHKNPNQPTTPLTRLFTDTPLTIQLE